MVDKNIIFQLKSKKILFSKTVGLNLIKTFKKYNIKYHTALQAFLNKHESSLPRQRKEVTLNNIDFLKMIKTYRGVRHASHLPVRGQRTHTNAKTSKKLN